MESSWEIIKPNKINLEFVHMQHLYLAIFQTAAKKLYNL